MRRLTLSPGTAAAHLTSLLRAGAAVRFVAHGGSMRPFLRDGDVLTVEPVLAGELRQGDVALFEMAPKRIGMHRLVTVQGTGDQRRYVFAGDSQRMPDSPVTAGEILGRVVAAERTGHQLRLDEGWRRYAAQLWRATRPFGPIALCAHSTARSIAGWLLRFTQGCRVYRIGARWLANRTVRCRLAAPAESDAVARFIGAGDRLVLADPASISTLDIGRNMAPALGLVAQCGSRIVGAALLNRHPIRPDVWSDWWVTDVRVRPELRRAGLGTRLVQLAIDTTLQHGGSTLSLLCFRDDPTSQALYRGCGFRPRRLDWLQLILAREVALGQRARQLLVRPLSPGR